MSSNAATKPEQLLARARTLAPRVTDLRRAIHEQPEIGLHTPRTQQLVVDALAKIGVPVVHRGVSSTSVVAEIAGKAGGKGATVLLRADMDALPLTEHADVAWASQVPGAMHACGHDAHVAMLLGASEILRDAADGFAGTVRLLFQPGEEGCGGARYAIDEGVLDGVEAAFALHVEPGRQSCLVAIREGTMLAGSDEFSVTFHGSGGHASTPHSTRDPIPAIGPFVDGLSHVSARETDPGDRTVFSVTRVSGGTADNIIAPTAVCRGTIRSLSVEGRAIARDRLRRVAAGVAASRGLEATTEFIDGYPPTINDSAVVAEVLAEARGLGLATETMSLPFMGAEDFSYVLEQVPGAMAFLGAKVDDGGPLHSDLMKLDEDVLPLGAALHAVMALRLMRRPST